MPNADDWLTVGQVAELLGAQTWRVQRLIERGLGPKPSRIGRHQVFRKDDVPAVKKALQDAGYLKK